MNAFHFGIVNNLKRELPEEDGNFLTFSSDDPFSISFTAKHWNGVLEYSTDKRKWIEWDASEINSDNNVIYLRGKGNSVITGVDGSTYGMTMTSPTNSGISCFGNIMTLLDHVSPETAQMGVRCFAYMFNQCTILTIAPELPATMLADYCYHRMFWGCTSLTTAPELPATTLAPHCYRSMFLGCTNLTVAPELPATTLAYQCYRYMFYNCTSLTVAPELPAKRMEDECYQYMFYGCTGIKISPIQTGMYLKPWRIPTTGTGTDASDWNTSMLAGTGGVFTSNPMINTRYYQAG